MRGLRIDKDTKYVRKNHSRRGVGERRIKQEKRSWSPKAEIE